MEEQKNHLSYHVGTPSTFTLPDGIQVTIREQNAADDEILSRVSSGNKQSVIDNINAFVQNIIIDYNGTGKGLTLDEVEKLKVKCKHYILLKSRIHSLGTQLIFEYTCRNSNCKKKTSYTEDLTTLDQDLSDPKPVEELEGKSENVITPYKNGPSEYVELTLRSGVQVRYKYLTGKGEKFILGVAKDGQMNMNTEVFARGLEVYNQGEWVKVSSLNIFGARDMPQIRKSFELEDRQFIMATEIDCPSCGKQELVPLIGIEDFFLSDRDIEIMMLKISRVGYHFTWTEFMAMPISKLLKFEAIATQFNAAQEAEYKKK